MFKWFEDLVGMGDAAPSTSLPPVMSDNGPEADDNFHDWVEGANQTLTAMLRYSSVKHPLPDGVFNGPEKVYAQVQTPVAKVELVEAALDGPYHQSHTRAQIRVKLTQKAGNFELDSINDAMHGMMKQIPQFAGHLIFSPHEKDLEETQGSAGRKLLDYLASKGKFSKQELGGMGLSLQVNADKPACWNDVDTVRVSHKGGMVQVHIYPHEVKGDENEPRSSDQRVMDYLDQHHQAIMDAMRVKLHELNKMNPSEPNAMTEDEIQHLDFGISLGAKEGETEETPTVFLGKRDAEGKLQVTQLSTIDTDKVDRIFTDALLHSNDHGTLPDIFCRIADGPTIAKIARERLPNDPHLEKLLDYHMFRSKQDFDKQAEQEIAENKVSVQNAHIYPNDPYTVNLTFDLPHGVELDTLRPQLALAKNQLVLGAQRNYQAQTMGIAA